MGNRNRICDLDHNGECLLCDCWISECARKRLINKDYRWESKEELLEMFKDLLTVDNFTKEELDSILTD